MSTQFLYISISLRVRSSLRFFKCFLKYSKLKPSYLASQMLINPSKVVFLIIKHIQNTHPIPTGPQNTISGRFPAPYFFWTTEWGKQEIYNSRYLACLPLFNPYIHTIRSPQTIKPTTDHLSTIYTTSKHAFSLKKIVNLWTHNKS